MKKKILIISTVSRQFYLFEQGNIEVLKSLGYEVHAAANFSDANERLNEIDIIRHHIDIERSPYSLKNYKAYKQLKEIIKNEGFDIVHCHSPMGGVIGRIAAKSLSANSVIYTAHGFHFYKGAPLINWAIYYSIENLLAKYTDHLITINQEDFQNARKFKARNAHFVPGIGVDTAKFDNTLNDYKEKRDLLGIEENTVVLLSIGELIKRKNHETVLRALEKIKNENFIYLICGQGVLASHLQELASSLGIEEKVKFLGYRNDINEICMASDIFLFPSYQEGLPVSVMEAMCAGLPIIASDIRGNTDLIESGVGGYLINPEDDDRFSSSINKLLKDKELREKMGQSNKIKVKSYDKNVVKERMKEIYSNL